jgi:outer membrane protein OmpA-like peptidoglycan-associated protein
MISLFRLVRVGGMMLLMLLASATAALSDCNDLLQQFNQALERRALPEIKAVEAQIAGDAICGGRLIEVQRRRAALQLVLAQRMIDQGGATPQGEYEDLIVDADKPNVHWAAAKMLGDLRSRQRHFDEAARAYGRAIEIIKNPTKTPAVPEQQAIETVRDLAAQARILAANDEYPGTVPAFISAPKDERDGTIGGIFSENIRGFTPKSIPLPITFYTASTRFTQIGQAAASEFLTVLRQQRPQRITIVGHTDERGGDDYNMRLSSNRAMAVVKYLRDNGVTAPVVPIAKGKTEPISIASPTGLSREDIWALNRRVEWQRN